MTNSLYNLKENPQKSHTPLILNLLQMGGGKGSLPRYSENVIKNGGFTR